MNVDPGYKFIEEIRGGLQWFMMQSKSFDSSISLEKKWKQWNSIIYWSKHYFSRTEQGVSYHNNCQKP